MVGWLIKRYGYVTMDFFRFDQHAKIIEHWDVIQDSPK